MVGASIFAEAPVEQYVHLISFSDAGAPVRVTIGPEGATIGRTAPSDIVIASPETARLSKVPVWNGRQGW